MTPLGIAVGLLIAAGPLIAWYLTRRYYTNYTRGLRQQFHDDQYGLFKQVRILETKIELLDHEKESLKEAFEKLGKEPGTTRYRPPIWINTALFFHRVARVMIQRIRMQEGSHQISIRMVGEHYGEEGNIYIFGPKEIEVDAPEGEYKLEPAPEAPLAPAAEGGQP